MLIYQIYIFTKISFHVFGQFFKWILFLFGLVFVLFCFALLLSFEKFLHILCASPVTKQ